MINYCSEPGSEVRLTGRLILFSGKTGQVLQWKDVPDKRETYFSPVVYSLSNGTDIVLFGTGGETHPGALWAIGLMDLYHGATEKAIVVYSDNFKGKNLLFFLNFTFVMDSVIYIYSINSIDIRMIYN